MPKVFEKRANAGDIPGGAAAPFVTAAAEGGGGGGGGGGAAALSFKALAANFNNISDPKLFFAAGKLYQILCALYGGAEQVDVAFSGGALNRTPADLTVYGKLVELNALVERQMSAAVIGEFTTLIKGLTAQYQTWARGGIHKLYMSARKEAAASAGDLPEMVAVLTQLQQLVVELGERRADDTGKLLGYDFLAWQILWPVWKQLESSLIAAGAGQLDDETVDLVRLVLSTDDDGEQGEMVRETLKQYGEGKKQAAEKHAEEELAAAAKAAAKRGQAAAGPHYIVVGDLHGDVPALADKLFHPTGADFVALLQPEGVYTDLVKTYDALRYQWFRRPGLPADERAEFIVEFRTILQRIQLNPAAKNTILRLLGDMFHERGSNDFFMLLFLERLRELKVPLQIAPSNHDARLFATLEAAADVNFKAREGDHAYDVFRLLSLPPVAAAILEPESGLLSMTIQEALCDALCYAMQTRSAVEMLDLLEDPDARKILVAGGVIPDGDALAALRTRFKELFLSSMRLINYDVIGEGATATLRLYTHAPVPASLIFKIANALKITYQSTDSVADSVRMIEAINAAFMGKPNAFELLAAASAPAGLDDIASWVVRFGDDNALLVYNLHQLIWARYADYQCGVENFANEVFWSSWMDNKSMEAQLRLPAWTRDGRWQLVHGHDAKGGAPTRLLQQGRIFNLDSMVGYIGPLYVREVGSDPTRAVHLTLQVAGHQGAENVLYIYDATELLLLREAPAAPVAEKPEDFRLVLADLELMDFEAGLAPDMPKLLPELTLEELELMGAATTTDDRPPPLLPAMGAAAAATGPPPLPSLATGGASERRFAPGVWSGDRSAFAGPRSKASDAADGGAAAADAASLA